MEDAVYCRSGQLEIIHLRNKPFTYREHNHVSVYMIGLVLHGEIKLKCNGESVPYPPHSFFVIAPYQTHALSLPDTYDLLSICVDKNLVTTHESCELLGTLSKILLQLPADADHALLAKAVDAIYQCKSPLPVDNAVLPAALSLWRNLEHNYGLRLMADETCYSLYHYIKVFKRHVGITPHKFQIQSRVRKAQRMLEEGEMSADVASGLGFCDQSHFVKCFKGIVGLTPSEYRKAAKRIG